MKIFFASSIRGGRRYAVKSAEIMKILKKFGTVLSENIADESISKYGETNLTQIEIHDREVSRLKESDVVIAELTTPSLGVGYLCATALFLGKPTVGLFNGNLYELSAMLSGNGKIEVIYYDELALLADSLGAVFNRLGVK